MSTLTIGTNLVKMDEPCWSLKEIISPAADSKSVRRWQCISVVRNDRIAELRRDLGEAKLFQVSEFVIPGGVVDPDTGRGELLHTVGELIDIADYLREGPYTPPEKPEPYDLIGAYHDLSDRHQREQKRQTTIGTGGWIQRD